MKKLLLSGITAVALMAAGTAQAANAGLSLTGETGVARTPLAMALPPMTLAIAADYVGSKDLFIPIRLEFGVIDGLEVGGNYWFLDTEGDPKIWGMNAKYVIPKFVENLGIAVGGNYGVTSADGGFSGSTITVSTVASYTVVAGIPIIPSVGLQYIKAGGDFEHESGVKFFGSLVVMALPNLAVGGEFRSTNKNLDGNGADADFWVGARFMPIDTLTVQAGVINNANVGGADASKIVFHAGVQYAFTFGN